MGTTETGDKGKRRATTLSSDYGLKEYLAVGCHCESAEGRRGNPLRLLRLRNDSEKGK